MANTPSGVAVVNAAFSSATNRDWSMKLTNRRISRRSSADKCVTADPCPLTSASSSRLIRPVAQLLAWYTSPPHDDCPHGRLYTQASSPLIRTRRAIGSVPPHTSMHSIRSVDHAGSTAAARSVTVDMTRDRTRPDADGGALEISAQGTRRLRRAGFSGARTPLPCPAEAGTPAGFAFAPRFPI